MTAKARNLYEDTLIEIEKKLSVLIYDFKISNENNPIGPEVICNAFRAAVNIFDIPVKVKLIVLKLFDKFIIQHLNEFYNQAIEKLSLLESKYASHFNLLQLLNIPSSGIVMN